jgi:uncharacterized protein
LEENMTEKTSRNERHSRFIRFSLSLFALIWFSIPANAAEDAHSEHQLKNPDGSWKWTNELIHETSPYLLLHAHNPVDWYPWGPEALERAKAEDKPIFLSVGYSTCYWCHVMERKVFSNPEIATAMNALFINIKVDREERPDLDEIYMTATQILTEHGGWPNSVFLTPDLLPFYAGTYFPPEDSVGRPGFPKVLKAIFDAWTERRTELIASAEKVAGAIRTVTRGNIESAPNQPLDEKLVASGVDYLRTRYNAAYGGFGSAPKFPSPTNLELLLSEYQLKNDNSPLKMTRHTLDMMAYGGMYDQIGGGFHRYSVDAKWLVPHFEKMLYDNAQLAKVYLQAYQLTKNPLYRRVADETFGFIFREMTSPEGGFYSALDAETDAEEGKYYVWTDEEIQKTLGKKEAKLFMAVYGVDKGANFEGKSILYLPNPTEKAAEQAKKVSEAQLLEELTPLKTKLLKAREKRKRPLLDTKVIVSWNGLMVDAFAYGYEVLGDTRYRDAATKAADFILKEMRGEDGRLMHTYRNGVVKYDGYLDDYAFFVRGLLALHRATDDERWLREARGLTDTMIQLFWDDEGGGFYFTLADQQHLLVRTKNPYDSAIPSGNAVAANNLLALAQRTGEKTYLDRAEKTLQSFTGMMAQSPGGFMQMLLALNRYLSTDWTKIGKANDEVGIDILALPKVQSVERLAFPSGDALVKSLASVSSKQVNAKTPFDVKVQLEIAKGWHINANPPSQKELIPTTVSVNPDAPVEVVSVNYPKGESVHFDFSGESLDVYSGRVTISMKLKLKRGVSSEKAFPLDLTLKYQACDDQQCLAPSTQTIRVEYRTR